MVFVKNISDTRCDACKRLRFKKPLGKASVVIVFHNEASCTLYRTIYSILETTPAIFLQEIILVDDKSLIDERPELGKELDNYIKNNFLGESLTSKGHDPVSPDPELSRLNGLWSSSEEKSVTKSV